MEDKIIKILEGHQIFTHEGYLAVPSEEYKEISKEIMGLFRYMLEETDKL